MKKNIVDCDYRNSTKISLFVYVFSLHERQVLRRQNKADVKVEYPKIENDVLSHMFRKLIAQGMNDEQEDTIILLKTVILKLHNSKIK